MTKPITTTQFTARVKNDYMRFINQLMRQRGDSKNEALNYLLMHGIIRLAQIKKATGRDSRPNT